MHYTSKIPSLEILLLFLAYVIKKFHMHTDEYLNSRFSNSGDFKMYKSIYIIKSLNGVGTKNV